MGGKTWPYYGERGGKGVWYVLTNSFFSLSITRNVKHQLVELGEPRLEMPGAKIR